MSAKDVVGLVLAAGTSSRMGAARNKLLESIGGRPLVRIPIEAMRDAGLGRIVVVLGHEAERVAAVLPAFVESIVNARHAEGMGSSLAAGARHIRRTDPQAAILVCVGDLPSLSADPIRRVLDAFSTAGPDAVVVPVASGRRGHPVLFGAKRAAALESCAGDEGARGVVEAAGAAVFEVEVGTASILEDVDTPADLDG